jgi:hypothetical protein
MIRPAAFVAALAVPPAHAQDIPDPAGGPDLCWRIDGPVLFCPPSETDVVRSDQFPNSFGLPDAQVVVQITVEAAPLVPATGWAQMAALANVADAKVTTAEDLTPAAFELSDGFARTTPDTDPLPLPTWGFTQDGVSRRIYGLSSRVLSAPNITVTTQGSRALPGDPILMDTGALGAEAFDIAVSHQVVLYALRLDCLDVTACAAAPLGETE